MKRQAILVAASPKPNPIPGVFVDLDFWFAFLRSKAGGLWFEQEVVILKDPSRNDLVAAVNAAKTANYSLVVFAGHGETIKTDLPWMETRLFLSGSESILDRELNPGTARCSLVLDCCRRTSQVDEAAILVKGATFVEPDEDPVKARAAFDQALGAAEGGLVKVFATAVGPSAADVASFSQHLIFESNRWVQTNHGVLVFPEAVTLAAESMSAINPQQKPEYQGGRRLRHFPFAVRV